MYNICQTTCRANDIYMSCQNKQKLYTEIHISKLFFLRHSKLELRKQTNQNAKSNIQNQNI